MRCRFCLYILEDFGFELEKVTLGGGNLIGEVCGSWIGNDFWYGTSFGQGICVVFGATMFFRI